MLYRLTESLWDATVLTPVAIAEISSVANSTRHFQRLQLSTKNVGRQRQGHLMEVVISLELGFRIFGLINASQGKSCRENNGIQKLSFC